MVIGVKCQSEADTRKTAEVVAGAARCSDVILLSGEMGTGKSVFTRSMASALGIDEPIPSPTFNILLIHDGPKFKLYHFDLYRLENEDELYGMGLDEMIPPDDGIAVIEWPEICADAMPEKAVRIEISYIDGIIEERMIKIQMPDDETEKALKKCLISAGLNVKDA
ncbi:MAG: tRNA (adenosine(37)-N6)-threonylcarbamoyltransferase complex ATPase subunit type 1 TsaE [Clostridia bacterium]|nr:tRNA (adenosine(37)-N6)-threonylcarbamoyltransferase complex ATPase subunit type 1 TsaE [Clostridia bacterium]